MGEGGKRCVSRIGPGAWGRVAKASGVWKINDSVLRVTRIGRSLGAKGGRSLINGLCAVGWCLFLPLGVWSRRRLKRAQIKNILICNDVRGLGNLVLLSPLLINLKKLYPLAEVTVLMPETPLAGIVGGGGELADHFIFYDTGNTSKWRTLKYGWTKIRPQRFSLVLHTCFSGTLFIAFWCFISRCRYRIGYGQSQLRGFLNHYTYEDNGGHEIDRHLRLLDFTGKEAERRLAIQVTEADKSYAAQFLKTRGLTQGAIILGVHPGCDKGNLLKRWDPENFIAVINAFLETKRGYVLVFLGPDDMDLYDKFKERLEVGPHFVIGESINHVAAIIGCCKAFLSNDSGLMHVAAAMGVPITAIFGPTGTEKNLPLSRQIKILEKKLSCRPCYKQAPIVCSQPSQYCLEWIGSNVVYQAVDKLLES
jgi:lipopolysaccharide heptosyltransferase II